MDKMEEKLRLDLRKLGGGMEEARQGLAQSATWRTWSFPSYRDAFTWRNRWYRYRNTWMKLNTLDTSLDMVEAFIETPTGTRLGNRHMDVEVECQVVMVDMQRVRGYKPMSIGEQAGIVQLAMKGAEGRVSVEAYSGEQQLKDVLLLDSGDHTSDEYGEAMARRYQRGWSALPSEREVLAAKQGQVAEPDTQAQIDARQMADEEERWRKALAGKPPTKES